MQYLLECSELETLDARLFRHQLVCSWRSLSMYSSTAAVARSLYTGIREPAARARALGCLCSWVFFLVCVSVRDASRLCRRPALRSLPLCLSLLWFSSRPAQHSYLFCSGLPCSRSRLLSKLASLIFDSTSAPPLIRRLRLLESR